MAAGTLFLLVGNSGTGKDTLLSYVQAHWRHPVTRLVVPRRYITRPASDTEPFHAISRDSFDEMRERGDFVLVWNSYDTWYGVHRDILDELEAGNLVVVNVSRQIIADTVVQFPSTRVILVDVPIEILAERISKRGRETPTEIVSRLERARSAEAAVDADVVVNNGGSVEEAGAALLAYLERFAES